MSLADFQRGLALLIRLPDHHRGADVFGLLQGFELEPEEREQLIALAADRRVAKFGRSMANTRWALVSEKLSLTPRYIAPAFLETVYHRDFEPAATREPWGTLVTSFLEFLLTEPRTAAILEADFPPFVPDVLRFELADLRFRHKIRDGAAAPPESLLRHGMFERVRLEHDIPGVLEALVDGATPAPEPRTLEVLMLAVDGGDSALFEIDRDLSRFLDAELAGGPPTRGPLPEDYDVLAARGLFRPAPRASPNAPPAARLAEAAGRPAPLKE